MNNILTYSRDLRDGGSNNSKYKINVTRPNDGNNPKKLSIEYIQNGNHVHRGGPQLNETKDSN
jgi:predicted alpha/beta superfamily hydrolase